jgi:folylpolyglutamate synthase
MRGYKDAVRLLNTLQTNKAILDILRLQGALEYAKSIPEMLQYASRCGYPCPSDFDSLNVIHVSGTKGKGSTCAMISSIISQKGRKVGLFTSPHLLQVRERIRIDGHPISQELFALYFFEVWDRLEATSSGASGSKRNDIASRVGVDSCAWDKPGYFRYLTLMALHVFKREEV